MRGLVAEAACHAAATALDQFGLRLGNEPEHLEDGHDRGERLLVAVPVKQDRMAGRLELDRKTTRPGFPRDELLEQQCLFGDRDGLVAQTHHQCLVAQRKQARRLEADDRYAALRELQQGVDQRLDLVPGLCDLAAGEERAAAAVVAAAFLDRVQRVAGGLQHACGGVRVPALEDAVERVDEQDRGAAAGLSSGQRLVARREQCRIDAAPEGIGAPCRQ